ncbi:methyl-accepting chemotaxis protein [Massilia luteola]|uniref:methyl-accepting chemotaxis protein n=1 Tax=Massilia luteola TaxID=3081751 RepID=UPI002ACC2E14|nr:methyl-accepting chemotaxis protein [Massilia sp. Gc5]
MKLSNLKIGTRLYFGFGGIVLLMLVLLTIAYTNFARLGKANELNIHTYRVLEEVNGMLGNLVNVETGERGFALTGNEASLEPLNEGQLAFKIHFEKAKSLTADNPHQQERLQKLNAAQHQWLADAIDPVIAMRRDVADGNMDGIITFERAGKGKRGMDAMRALLADMDKEERSLLAQRITEANALRSLTSATIIGGGIVTAILAALLALWLTANITKPIGVAVDLAQRVAKGDLTAGIEATSTDETGQLIIALKDMNDNLARIVTEVRNGTETIVSASDQIASGNMDLSGRTEEQASSLEETASSVEELTSTVQQNADHARQANHLATSASEVAQKGGSVVSEVVQTMGSINDSARKIVDIISVIDGIAFQTNILALNAAVEAARAGEQGRGFAVVASEVRTLAQRSANAAKEIKALIGDSVEKVEVGSKLVDQAGATMEEVVASVKRVTEIISEIAEASAEQRNGIEQVNQAITQMDQATQQNAALVEEAAAAANSLKDQASNLDQMVSVFKLPGAQQSASHRTASVNPIMGRRVALKAMPTAPVRSAALTRPTATAGEEWAEF